MTRAIDRSPARLSAALSLTAASIAVATAAVATPAAGVVGVAGLVGVGVGVHWGSRRATTLGATLLLVGALLGGLIAPSPLVLLPGVMATVLAWDLGDQAVDVGAQLGRDAPTARLEVTHAAASTVVAIAGGGLGYAIFLAATGGQPVSALVFLLLAVVVLASALRT